MSAVTTVAVALGPGPRLIQNLGPDDLYVGSSNMNGDPLVTAEDGIRLSSGESISLQSTSSKISVVSSGTSEVRHLSSGTGVYPVSAATAPAA